MIKNILLTLFSLALAILVIEALLRLEIFDNYRFPFVEIDYVFNEYDDKLGWKNTPNISFNFNEDEFSTQIKHNALGMRDREIAAKPEKTRIAVLGDSFVWGFGVNVNERLTEIAAQDLAADEVEILNFGVVGYGPIQYYLMLDQVLALKPKAVIVCLSLWNDFHDNVVWRRYRHYGPYAEVEQDTLKIQGYPLPNVSSQAHPKSPLEKFLRYHSRIYGVYKKIQWLNSPQAGLVKFTYEAMYDPASEDRAKAIAVNHKLFQAMQQRCDAAGTKLILCIAPGKYEYAKAKEHFDPAAARTPALKTAQLLNIPCIDPSAELSMDDFYVIDSHWNPKGHAKMGHALSLWIKNSELSGKKP